MNHRCNDRRCIVTAIINYAHPNTHGYLNDVTRSL